MYDPELYRDKQEVEEWKKRDPISGFIGAKEQKSGKKKSGARSKKESGAKSPQSMEFAEAGTWEPVKS